MPVSREDAGKKDSDLPSEGDPFSLDIAEMINAGLHFGQRVPRTHPKMLPYIFGVRNTIHIIDLEKTLPKFREALEFIRQLAQDEKTLLFVGTKPQIKNLVIKTAQACGMPYVAERWLGGTLTNFSVIAKRIEYLKELERRKEEGELERYTKKEKAEFEKELKRLREKFEGIKHLSRLPDALFVCNASKGGKVIIQEARMKHIPVIAICDTDADPGSIDYPIPANDDAISSVGYILEKVKLAIELGKNAEQGGEIGSDEN